MYRVIILRSYRKILKRIRSEFRSQIPILYAHTRISFRRKQFTESVEEGNSTNIRFYVFSTFFEGGLFVCEDFFFLVVGGGVCVKRGEMGSIEREREREKERGC